MKLNTVLESIKLSLVSESLQNELIYLKDMIETETEAEELIYRYLESSSDVLREYLSDEGLDENEGVLNSLNVSSIDEYFEPEDILNLKKTHPDIWEHISDSLISD